MTYFSSLLPEYQNIICLFLFAATLTQLALCIYKWIMSRSIRHLLADFAVFALMVTLLSFGRASYNAAAAIPLRLPWIVLPTAALLVCMYAVFAFLHERKLSKTRLTQSSVKQALDNLESGICFCDKSGRIILINHMMNRLTHELLGSLPQSLAEIESALTSPPKGACIVEEDMRLYRLNDGRIWSFSSAELSGRGVEGFTQITARDVTELYESGEKLRRENAELRKTNDELSEMYERLADIIREEETLNLKTRVHSDIGTSLISISEIMSGKSDGDADAQLGLLKNAVSYFADVRPSNARTFENERKKAAEMNITLELLGELPESEKLRELIAEAAGECVTNCFNHARGDRVTLSVTANGGEVKVKITNNGNKPDGEIKEGGGLSSLRKRIENAGGTMTLKARPRFEMLIVLEDKDD